MREPLSVSDTTAPLPTEQRPRVFLIHGRNLELREAAARLIDQLGLSVIALNEMPSRGRTIVETFESLSNVDYVVALMTADDLSATQEQVESAPKFRARQNVVFELGFFTARLGRSRLAVLVEEGVEMPSDFSGIVYIRIDSLGGWKLKLARELKIAGFPVDLGKVTKFPL